MRKAWEMIHAAALKLFGVETGIHFTFNVSTAE